MVGRPKFDRPAQQGAHACHHFVHGERFSEIVVSACLEALHSVAQGLAAGSDLARNIQASTAHATGDPSAVSHGFGAVDASMIMLIVVCDKKTILLIDDIVTARGI